MQKYINNVSSRNGVAVNGAVVTVTTLGGVSATIYTDNGVTIRTTPLITNANGYFEFYAADGRYTLTISSPSLVPTPFVDIILFDPVNVPALLSESNLSITTQYAYAGGIVLTAITQTVSYLGQAYEPISSALPFTTGGTFEAAKFKLVKGVVASDLAAPGGSAMIGGGDQQVISIAALRLLLKTSAAVIACTTGYYTPGDGGGGSTYYLDLSDNTSSDNGITVIVAADGGRWKMLLTGTLNPKQAGAKGDAVANDFTAWSNLIIAANATKSKINPTPGEYVIGSTLPTYTGPSIQGTGVGVCILRFNTQGNCLVIKPTTHYVEAGGLYVTNSATGTAAIIGACIRIKNVVLSKFGVLYGACDLDNYADVMLEQEYDGSAADGDFINHIGCWYNSFENVSANYINSAAGNKGYGLKFYVNPNAINVVNPNGASPGTYTGSCNWNTVKVLNSEQRARNVDFMYSNGNTIIGGKLLKGNSLVYNDGGTHNHFINVSLTEWTVAPVTTVNTTGTAGFNRYDNPQLSNSLIAQPWSIGTLAATDTLSHSGDGFLTEQREVAKQTNTVAYKVITTGSAVPRFQLEGQSNDLGNRGTFLSSYANRSLVIGQYDERNGAETALFSFGLNLTGQKSFRPEFDNALTLGTGVTRWDTIFSGTGSINTSDKRDKQQILPIDDAAIRAIKKLNFKQFKFNSAVEDKGTAARWHYGVIAQEIKEAFESEGLNAFEYGVLCYDEWNDQPELRDDKNRIIQNFQAAGSRYGVRYEELLCLKMASF